MVTRLYFPVTTPSEVNPSFDGGWEFNSEALRRKLVDVKGASAITAGTQIGPWTAGQDALDRQYVSAPMNSGISFSGVTVKMQIMTREFAGTDNSTSRLGIRIVNRAGDTVQQTLLSVANYGPTTEYVNNATYRNKTFANSDTVTGTYTTIQGDRLVVEVGHSDATGTTPEGACKFGEDATDLPENETQTSNGAGWVEFSNTITFEVDPAIVMHSYSYLNTAGDMIPRKINVYQPFKSFLTFAEYLVQANTLLNRYYSWAEILAPPFSTTDLVGAWEANRQNVVNTLFGNAITHSLDDVKQEFLTLSNRYKSWQTFLPAPPDPLTDVGFAMSAIEGFETQRKLIQSIQQENKLKKEKEDFNFLHTLANRFKSWFVTTPPPFDEALAMVVINSRELIDRISRMITHLSIWAFDREGEVQKLTLANRYKSWKASVQAFADYTDIIEIDPAQFSGFTDMRLVIIMKTNMSGNTAIAKLTNVTDSTTDITLTTTKDFFTTIRSSSISLPVSAKQYKVEIGANLGETTTIKYAGLELR